MLCALGIDFGTSGARAIVIDAEQQLLAQVVVTLSQPEQPQVWRATLFDLLGQIPAVLRQRIGAIAVNGTSSTVLMCDAQGQPRSAVLMYNDARGAGQVDFLRTIAPPRHTVLSPTSSLAKLLWLQQQPEFAAAQYFLHQADWLAALLHGQWGVSDYHNALKLGYDVGALRYPDWLTDLDLAPLLPQVMSPGQVIGPVTASLCETFGLPASCLVCAGTTDSIAAFLASGVAVPGEAVTSLGSTLAVKLLSETRVDDSRYGIYSHRLGNLWLVGGASNTGGAVLKAFFSKKELVELSKQIDPNRLTELDYYPLIKPGDRFPVNDPTLPPRLVPRPASSVRFLQGMLEGMARIEAKGYALLQQLGASPLIQVKTAGGGAQNLAWTALRQQQLGVPVSPAPQIEAAYGVALLAQSAL
ncbi:FGGY-family carbohydrate kinase [filamentous cyanobacterium LEGE 11480]|uniref:D-ribulose kinase n=2 Tax=Romeriopsis TaxID=2992131 RepID=A0A928Z4Y3_9CYAN|nr:FGGY-family carbohydrate kinase [Romeriopsis navalis LEGE 11480]